MRRSFADFARGAWAVVEPSRPLLPSVAFDGICAALQEAGERGGRWAISCPPGVSKSILCSVIFPAWLLLRSGGARRIMAGSYSWDFATRDARRCRDLITSDWYRGLVGDAWSIRDDADRRDDYWTSTGGRRLVTSVSGKAIGERVDVQVLDDVLNGADVHSAAARKEAIRWVTEVLPSRLDDPEYATRVIVGQRLHPEDPISVAVEQGWQHLVLPALATDAPCELRRADGSLIWRDERAPGEPLFELLGVDALARLKVELGSAAFSAQYMQVPRDDESSMVPPKWWRFYRAPHAGAGSRRPTGCDDSPAAELPAQFDTFVISADLSFGSLKGDYSVVQVWGARGGARYLLTQWRQRAGFEAQLAAIKGFAAQFPNALIAVEKAANGAAVIETLSKTVPNVVPQVPQGAKAQRLASVVPTIESGSVYLPEHASFTDDIVEEFAAFPVGKHDDIVDAAVWALLALAGPDPDRASFIRTQRALWGLTHGGTPIPQELLDEKLAVRDRRRAGVASRGPVTAPWLAPDHPLREPTSARNDPRNRGPRAASAWFASCFPTKK